MQNQSANSALRQKLKVQLLHFETGGGCSPLPYINVQSHFHALVGEKWDSRLLYNLYRR